MLWLFLILSRRFGHFHPVRYIFAQVACCVIIMANELREDKSGRRRQRNDRSAYPPSDAPQRRRPSAFSSDREVQGRTRQCILHACIFDGWYYGISAYLKFNSFPRRVLNAQSWLQHCRRVPSAHRVDVNDGLGRPMDVFSIYSVCNVGTCPHCI